MSFYHGLIRPAGLLQLNQKTSLVFGSGLRLSRCCHRLIWPTLGLSACHTPQSSIKY
uniref:Uncharacterized protein n=1 Tax=Anguilla anguilla TaxID=7936 RepID=A0A0E9WLB2_ANGAN